jgi:hypothetical protein
MILLAFFLAAQMAAHGGPSAALAAATAVRCEFEVLSTGSWKEGAAQALVQPATLRLAFEAINTDEGTATGAGEMGRSDIIAKLSSTGLHFIQMFRDGPLYVTTVFVQESHPGKFKAVHTRHEENGVRIPGFTSSPEQYYGECEAAKAGE